MKAGEIIEKLSRFDPDDKVYVFDHGIKALVPVEAVAESATEGQEGVVIYMEE
jgi:hypothetical protein